MEKTPVKMERKLGQRKQRKILYGIYYGYNIFAAISNTSTWGSSLNRNFKFLSGARLNNLGPKPPN
jgi:hypothetical protein